MFKKLVFTGLGAALLATPFLASADTLDALKAQVQQLLAQVQVLQSSQSAAAGGSSLCVDLSNNMGLDDSDATKGGEVTKLQQFLTSISYSEVVVSGLYGPTTESGVKHYQCDKGIVCSGTPQTTGYGYVGPKTRASMACGGSGGTGEHTISATPSSGGAPLAVTFYTDILSKDETRSQYSVDFGDGSNASTFQDSYSCSGSGCNPPLKVAHTYSSNGSYTAKLQKADSSGTTTVSTAAVNVSGSTQQGSLTVSPSSGRAALRVTFSTTVDPGTSGAQLYVDFGDSNNWGRMSKSGSTYTITHTYSADGTYTAALYYRPCPTCIDAQQKIGEATVVVDSSSGGGTCDALKNDMSLGDDDSTSDGEVSILQAFLVDQGFLAMPSGVPYGYFGRLTETAVKDFQKKYDVLQTGYVGPLTRAAIKAVCGGEKPGNSSYSFKGDPSSGDGPLAVTFTATAVDTGPSIWYAVDFGDGTTTPDRANMAASTSTTGLLYVKHTYTNKGKFTAQLLQEEDLCGIVGTYTYGCTKELNVDKTEIEVKTGSSTVEDGMMHVACTTNSAAQQRLDITFANGSVKQYYMGSGEGHQVSQDEAITSAPTTLAEYHPGPLGIVWWVAHNRVTTPEDKHLHLESEDGTDDDYNDLVCDVTWGEVDSGN